MSAAWGALWAVAGVLIGVVTGLLPGRPLEWVLDPWAALAVPGFLGGMIFSAVLGTVQPRRRVEDTPVARLLLCGATTGLVLGVFPLLVSTPTTRVPLGILVIGTAGTAIVLSALSAVVSAAFFRRLCDRRGRARPPARVPAHGDPDRTATREMSIAASERNTVPRAIGWPDGAGPDP
jgi:hypothetical protein